MLSQKFCCPLGASVINQACGCDSTGATQQYIVASTLNLVLNSNALNATNALNSLTTFSCEMKCPPFSKSV